MALPRLHLVHFIPLNRSVVASKGSTLLDAAHRAGVGLPSVCSGQGWCRECRVVVLEGEVSALTSDEEDNLSSSELRAGVRLACCTRLYSAVKIQILGKPTTPLGRSPSVPESESPKTD